MKYYVKLNQPIPKPIVSVKKDTVEITKGIIRLIYDKDDVDWEEAVSILKIKLKDGNITLQEKP